MKKFLTIALALLLILLATSCKSRSSLSATSNISKNLTSYSSKQFNQSEVNTSSESNSSVIQKDQPIYTLEHILFPDSAEYVFKNSPDIVVVKVQSVKSVQYLWGRDGKENAEFTPSYNRKDYIRTASTISTVKVTDVLKGTLNVGQTISFVKRGDGVNYINSGVEEEGGYVKPKEKWLIFIREASEKFNKNSTELFGIPSNEKAYFGPTSVIGQIAVNSKNELVFKSSKAAQKTTKELLGIISTVDDMKRICEKYK